MSSGGSGGALQSSLPHAPTASSNQSLQRCVASPTDLAHACASSVSSHAIAMPAIAASSHSALDGDATACASASPPPLTAQHSDSTLAKRVASKPRAAASTAAATPASSTSASSGRSLSPPSARRSNPSPNSAAWHSDESAGLLMGEEDEEDEEDDLSIENFMRRNPCILDRGSAWLDRNPWVYQLGVVSATITAVCVNTVVANTLTIQDWHLWTAYAFVLLDLVLFGFACLRPPGRPAQCRDESGVIKLLHEWPASSHHYGLHASEWSRSWSYCHTCANWRPARAHHCSKCKQCVLLMDHHCVWIGQCVGANNFRHFSGYVFSLFTLSLYSLSLCWRYAHHPQIHLSLFGVQLVLALCGAAMGGYLCARCVRLVLRNETAIEGMKKDSWRREQAAMRAQKQNAARGAPLILDKAHMLIDAGNGSSSSGSGHPTGAAAGASRGSVASSTGAAAGVPADAEAGLSSSSSSVAPVARFFSPFQCACHSSSFRPLHCQRFNYPTLLSSSTPIPPLPFYFDYDAHGSCGLNCYLWLEDLRRMERLHRWVSGGARPLPLPPDARHMRLPPTDDDDGDTHAHALHAQANAEQRATNEGEQS